MRFQACARAFECALRGTMRHGVRAPRSSALLSRAPVPPALPRAAPRALMAAPCRAPWPGTSPTPPPSDCRSNGGSHFGAIRRRRRRFQPQQRRGCGQPRGRGGRDRWLGWQRGGIRRRCACESEGGKAWNYFRIIDPTIQTVIRKENSLRHQLEKATSMLAFNGMAFLAVTL